MADSSIENSMARVSKASIFNNQFKFYYWNFLCVPHLSVEFWLTSKLGLSRTGNPDLRKGSVCSQSGNKEVTYLEVSVTI